jgi:hypothetical protein
LINMTLILPFQPIQKELEFRYIIYFFSASLGLDPESSVLTALFKVRGWMRKVVSSRALQGLRTTLIVFK